MTVIRSLVAVLAILPAAVCASDGALDPEFAQGSGVFFPSFSYLAAANVEHSARAIAIGDDQGITVVGDFQREAGLANRDCGLLRTLPDASGYDSTFLPPNGYAHFAFDRGGSNADFCFAVGLRDDQGVIVVGSSTIDAAERRAGLVFQTTPDGSLDGAFFGDGVFDTSVDGPTELIASDVEFRHVIRDDAGFVVSGSALVPVLGGSNLAQGVVLRFHADGTLDEQFGDAGPAVLLGGDAAGLLEIRGMARGADGSLWFAGDRSGSGVGDGGRLFHMRADRSLDPDLGGHSGLSLPQCGFITAVAIDPTGAILLGCNPNDAVTLAGVLRLIAEPAGWLPDASFGDGGLASIRVRPEDTPGLGPALGSPTSIVVQADGRIVIAATYVNDRFSRNPSDAVVARLHQGGALDEFFGVAGIARFGFLDNIDLTRDTATAVALDAAARPVMVGGSYSTAAMSMSYVVARLQRLPEEMFRDSFEAP